MKLGFVISMYDEIDIVEQTISTLKQNRCKIVVVQSDPGDKNKILSQINCDKFELMPDLAGSKQNYEKIVEKFKQGNPEPIGPIALTRNFSRGFSIIRDFDVDYAIAITGDVKITNLVGIAKIIEKMKKFNKYVAGTRTIGYTIYDEEGKLERFQDRNSTDIMPQFFIADMQFVKKGLFCNIIRTNKYTTEQCLGDEIVRFCKENSLKFFDVFYSICDYAYPRFIDGLHYNPDKMSKMSPSIERIVNSIRKSSGRRINRKIDKLFRFILNLRTK